MVLSLFFDLCCSPGPPGASHLTYFDCALLGCLPLGSIRQAAPDHASVRMQTAYMKDEVFKISPLLSRARVQGLRNGVCAPLGANDTIL